MLIIFIQAAAMTCYNFTFLFTQYCLLQCPTIVLSNGQIHYYLNNSICAIINSSHQISAFKYVTLFTLNNNRFWLTSMTDQFWWRILIKPQNIKCPANCLKCNRDMICQRCFGQYILQLGKCFLPNQMVLVYNQQISQCEFIKILQKCAHKICQICDNNCKNCVLIGNKQCMNNYCVNNEFPCKQCLSNLKLINGICQCQIGKYYEEGICYNCIREYCQICSSQLCYTCKQNFKLTDKSCLCEYGYFIEDGNCNKCNLYCRACTFTMYCLQCKITFQFSKGNCYCPINNFIVDQQCIKCQYLADDKGCICPRGKYVSKNLCSQCDQNCNVCWQKQRCVMCSQGYKLQGGRCQKQIEIMLWLISMVGVVSGLAMLTVGYKLGCFEKIHQFFKPKAQVNLQGLNQRSQNVQLNQQQIEQLCFCFNYENQASLFYCHHCNHKYHILCIITLIQTDKRCPYCRYQIQTSQTQLFKMLK